VIALCLWGALVWLSTANADVPAPSIIKNQSPSQAIMDRPEITQLIFHPIKTPAWKGTTLIYFQGSRGWLV
jgi:hypothetical protein